MGKALVLKVVERTVELGWPRLDLYTWPGNTKAVPLYKKCGFFWEKRDDSTHLMNFIPTVLKTEALKDYFQKIDWYRDSQRSIEIVPDGEKEDDYSLYSYLWENDEKRLQVQFERKSRGIRMIETEDYLIRARIEDDEPVAGYGYQVSYDIINKNDGNLEVSIEGINDENISFAYQKTVQVADELTLTADFDLEEIKEEQDRWKTHPAVTAVVTINGKSALFKVGVRPRYPVNLAFSVPERELSLNIRERCYLNLENGFKEFVEVELEFSDTELVSFADADSHRKLTLNPGEKRSIPVDLFLAGYHFYSEDIPLTVYTRSGEYQFKKRVTAAFRGRGASFGGESEKEWVICNGEYYLKLSKENNMLSVRNFSSCQGEADIMYPRLVKRSSMEFANRRAEKVTFARGTNPVMKVDYRSEDLQDVVFRSVITLAADGVVKNHYEIINQGEADFNGDIWVGLPIYFDLIEATLPLENSFVYSRGSEAGQLDSWNLTRLTENWLFSRDNGVTRGIAWPDKGEFAFHEWYFSIDFKLQGLAKGEKKIIEPLILAWDTCKDWREFRAYITQKSSNLLFRTGDGIDLIVNDGNPIINGDFTVSLKEYKKASLKGMVEIHSIKGLVTELSAELSSKDNLREKKLNLSLNNNTTGPDSLKFSLDLKSKFSTREKIIFAAGDNKIKGEVKTDGGKAGLPPTFLIFTDKYLEERLLSDLNNIRLMIED